MGHGPGAGRPAAMRVVLATYGFPLYGHGFLENHVRALAELGVDVCVVASADGDHPFVPSPPGSGPGRVTIVPASWSDSRPKKVVTLLRALRSAAAHNPRTLRGLLAGVGRRHGVGRASLEWLYVLTPVLSAPADVVHLGWLSAATQWMHLLPALDVPVVVTCHGSDLRLDPLSDDGYADRARLVFERADVVHCVSNELVAQAVAFGLDPSKAFVTTWGIDTDLFCPGPEQGRPTRPPSAPPHLRVVSVGRVHWVKGYEFALQALSHVRCAGVEVEYTIIGDGDDKARLSVLAAVRDLDLEGRVHLRGSLPPGEVLHTLRDTDVFLHASLSEGLSNAVLEAMAVGMPVVVTDVGGTSEAVTDGVEGFVVPPRDPAALAQALLQLAADPDLGTKLGARGRERVVEDFDFRDRARGTLERYQRLVEDHARRRR